MARDPSLRQRGGSRYNFADHAVTGGDSSLGKYYTRSSEVETWGLKWNDGVTTIRIYPVRDRDNPGHWSPYRYSAEHNQFGDWLRSYPAVRGIGDPSVSFIMCDPADPLQVDKQGLPPYVLFNAITDAKRNGQDQPGWSRLLDGGKNRSPQLPRPSAVTLVQGCLVQHGSQVYWPPRGFMPDQKTVMMELSTSAANAMLEQMNALIEGADPTTGDWESICVNGDPISLATGRFVNFYTLAQGDPRQVQAQPQQMGWDAPSQRPGSSGGRNEPIGYGCYLEPTYNNQISAAMQEYVGNISQKVKDWDDILWFPTPEEQAHLLADKFDPSVILYAFRDHPEWIPDTVRSRAVAQHQVAPNAGASPEAAAALGFSSPGTPPVGPAPAAGQGQWAQPAQAQPPQQEQQPPAAGFSAMMPSGVGQAQQPQEAAQREQPPAHAGFGPPAGGGPGQPQQMQQFQQPAHPQPTQPHEAAAALSWNAQPAQAQGQIPGGQPPQPVADPAALANQPPAAFTSPPTAPQQQQWPTQPTAPQQMQPQQMQPQQPQQGRAESALAAAEAAQGQQPPAQGTAQGPPPPFQGPQG